MKKFTVSLLVFCSLLCTACSSEDALNTADSILDQASVIFEEQESIQSESVSESDSESVSEMNSESEYGSELFTEYLEIPEESSDEYSTADELFDAEVTIAEDGVYTSKEDVALYIHIYQCLPDNFITKKEAQDLGWEGGSLEPYAPGMCIGGNRFGNYEGLLPEEDGRSYTECDIDTLGASSRGAKRIVFSNDGLIYYTEDHYETFELLYGEE